MPTVSPTPPLTRPIVLVGLMGCGKTTVGTALAARLGRPFWDGDAKLIAVTGLTAAALREERGLDVLHGLEVEVMSMGLVHHPAPVVAASAAVVLDQRLPGLLLGAWTVWLQVELMHLLGRLQQDDGHRPLLGGDLLGTLREMARVREPLYEQVADLTLDATLAGPAALVQRILQAMPAA